MNLVLHNGIYAKLSAKRPCWSPVVNLKTGSQFHSTKMEVRSSLDQEIVRSDMKQKNGDKNGSLIWNKEIVSNMEVRYEIKKL